MQRELKGVIIGITRIPVTIRNLVTREEFTTNFVIDTENVDSIVPSSQLKRIGIEPVGKRTYEGANGEFQEYEHGFVELSFLDERIPGKILFGPETAHSRLGRLTLIAAAFKIDPRKKD